MRCLLLLACLLSSTCQQGRPALIVIDQSAGPHRRGALFLLDPATAKVELFAAPEQFRQPQDVLQQQDGSFLVLDYCDEGGAGKLFRLSADARTCTEVPLPKGLVDPFHFERAPDGAIWIADKNADPLGLGAQQGTGTGTLWRLSADLATLEVIATGPPLAAPAAVLFDGDEVLLLDADAFQQKPFDLANDEGAIFRVRKHPAPLEVLVRLQKLVSPLSLHRTADGAFLVVDVNADPVERARIRGAVYRVDQKTGATALFASHEQFRDPVTGLVFAGGLLVCDANADPLGLGDDGTHLHYAGTGRGAIYRVDLATREVALFAADPRFVNPIRVRAVQR